MPPDESFSRIKLISRQNAPEEIHSLYEAADRAMREDALPGPSLFGNQVRALAHNPPLLQALTQVYRAFANTQSVERRLVELGILVVSRVNACRYCIQHHAPLAHRAGLRSDQLEAIADGDWAARRPLWSAEEWLVIRYAEMLAQDAHEIDEGFFRDLGKRFSDRQIVDMTMRFSLCAAWNKFNDALGLDTESAFQHAFAELGLAAESFA